MNITIFLKSIKYYLIHNRFNQFLKFYFLYIIKSLIKLNFSKKVKLLCLGNFYTRINPSSLEELKSYNNNLHDIHYIQSLRNFIDPNTTVFTANIKSEVLLNFIDKTLNKKKFYNFNPYKKIRIGKVIKNKTKFLEILKNNNNENSIFIIDGNDNFNSEDLVHIFKCSTILTKYKLKNNIPKKFNIFFYDVFGKVNLSEKNNIIKYYIYSTNELVKNNNNKIVNGISVLKDLDSYPFDICYESVLKFVDEFHLGIDITSFNYKYEKILNKFLQETKFKNKIKIHFHDFQTNTLKNCHVRGRWIADAFNYLSNKCQSKYILNMGADELFDIKLNKKFYKTLKYNQYYEEYFFNFHHFVFNLDYIRDPKYAAYNEFVRVFNRKRYVSVDDGMGFRKNNNFRPKFNKLNLDVYHIGYLTSFDKKIRKHFSKRGLFSNVSNTKDFKKNMYPIKVDHDTQKSLFLTIQRYKYMDSYRKLKKYLKINNEK